jgi:hypothetical protein
MNSLSTLIKDASQSCPKKASTAKTKVDTTIDIAVVLATLFLYLLMFKNLKKEVSIPYAKTTLKTIIQANKIDTLP